MSVLLRELFDSRQISAEIGKGTITLRYMAIGSIDEQDTYDAVFLGTVPYYGLLQRQKIALSHLGGAVWDASVDYGPSQGEPRDTTGTPPAEPSPTEPLGYEFSFDTTGGTQHITQSRNTVSRTKRGGVVVARNISAVFLENGSSILAVVSGGFTANDVGAGISVVNGNGIPTGATILSVGGGGTSCVISAAATATSGSGGDIVHIAAIDAPDHKGAIGVSKDGVAGCDIVVPKLEFSITRDFLAINLAYIAAVSTLTGKTNDKTYFGFDTGEVLFLGGTGQGALDKRPRVTFKFAVAKNRKEIFICDGLEVPEKKGWEYLWIEYEDAVDGASRVTRPKAAYVEEVYEAGDLLQLGL